MSRSPRLLPDRRIRGTAAAALLLALVGCSAEPAASVSAPAPSTDARTPPPTASQPDVARVAGYDVGQFPPVPLFTLPDLSLLDGSASAFTIAAASSLSSLPGVTVDSASCDTPGGVSAGAGTAVLYGDGAGAYTGPDGAVHNFGDGSGSTTIGGIEIQNFGDGAGTVDGVPVTVDPLPPVPKLGVFPPLAALAPVAGCGTTLTLSDAVLFDFDSAETRPDAASVLDALATVLTRATVPAATVSGHTDAIGTDAENQVLSERRANAVVEALRQRGTPTSWTAEGYGESRPVAANETNRRVEILVPAFGG